MMADRPTEQDLALDAIDDAFKSVIVQYTKDRIEGAQIDIAAGILKALRSRKSMIAMVAAATSGDRP